MKRQFPLIIFVVMFLFCFCACSGGSKVSSGDEFEFEQLRWPTYDNAKQIPIPKSTMADVRNCNDVRFEFYLANTTFEDYKAYVEECKAMGFMLDAIEQENRYYALSEAEYELTVEHQTNDVMFVGVVEIRNDVEIKLLHANIDSANMYYLRIEIDGSWEEDSEIGDEAITFDSYLKEGTHTLLIENDDDDDINGRIEFSVSEETTYYEFEINCLSNKIEIKSLDGSSVDTTVPTATPTTTPTSAPESKKEDTSSNNMIAGDCFVYTARDFMKRFDESYDSVDAYNYVYMRSDNINLYYELASIENYDDVESVGMAVFYNEKGKELTIDDDYTENIINKITVLVEDVDDVVPILVGCMCGADPSLNFTSAFNIAQNIVENAGTEEGYTYNNVNYVIVTDDEYFYIIIKVVGNEASSVTASTLP